MESTASLASVVPKVREGAELWRTLEGTGQFTSLAVEMVKVGEATGALEDQLLSLRCVHRRVPRFAAGVTARR